MSFRLPDAWSGRPVYAVFRNADGTLTAILVRYAPITQSLAFESTVLGDFVLICPDFDGEPFTPEFYDALKKLPEVQLLIALH